MKHLSRSYRHHVAYMSIALVNLGPLLGVIWGKWTAFDVVFLYWLENIVIGVFAALRMALRPNTGIAFRLGGLFMAAFFCLHYGLFCFAHGSIVMGLVGNNLAAVQEAGGLLDKARRVLEAPELAWAARAILLAHLVLYIREYLREEMDGLMEEMKKPYRRLIILHVALIAGAMLAVAAGDAGIAIVLLMVIGKIISDIHYTRQDARKKQRQPAGNKVADQIIQHIQNSAGEASLDINGRTMTYRSYTEMRDSPQYRQFRKWAGFFLSRRDIQRIEAAFAEKIAKEEGGSGVVLDGEAYSVDEHARRIPRDSGRK